MKRDQALKICKVSKHQYYYFETGGVQGKKPSEYTPKLLESGEWTMVKEEQIVQEITDEKKDPDTDYGYRKMCVALMLMGYYINHKKVYRIMAKHHLLHDRHKRPSRIYARYRKVYPKGPLEVLEMDIKYQWVEAAGRHSFILTILDTFTRVALHWDVGYTMQESQIKKAWEYVIVNHLQKNDTLSKGIQVEIRNDNGPQFASIMIQQFFKDNYLNQVFTHPYTPQENGHVESFHAILSESLGRQRFFALNDLEKHLSGFYHTYNNKRLHASIATLCPMTFRKLWNQNMIEAIEKKNKTITFKLKVPYYTLSGNGNPRVASCTFIPDPQGQSILIKI